MSLKQQVQNPAVQPPATATSVDAAAEPLHQRGPREKAQERIERPLRAGVFSDVAAADRVVESLVQSGFAPEEITVVCSEESVQRHFQEFGHEKPAGTFTPAAAAAGSVIGATLGGLAAIVSLWRKS
mgnify:CR=1 FL=1